MGGEPQHNFYVVIVKIERVLRQNIILAFRITILLVIKLWWPSFWRGFVRTGDVSKIST